MNFLKITNKGLICAEDLMLIGSSSKREQTGKIGMFGSGWKYALSWLIRNDLTPTIYSGQYHLKIGSNVKLHRDTPVQVITVDGQETSLTTQMGPKWTGWMAIREILSNAIDEGGHTITTVWAPEFKGEQDKTVVYIPMNGELSDVMLKFDAYFAFYRKESYVTPVARIFFKTEQSNFNIYRKGIRCFDTSNKTGTDFDFTDININEDRLTNETHINNEIRKVFECPLPTNIFERLLKEGKPEWLPYDINEYCMANIKALLQSGCNFTTPAITRLMGTLFSTPNTLTISDTWYKHLNDLGLVKAPFENFGGTKYNFIRTDAKSVDGLKYCLKGWNLDLKVLSGKTETDCFYENGTVYVKDDTLLTDKQLVGAMFYGMGREEIASLVRD